MRTHLLSARPNFLSLRIVRYPRLRRHLAWTTVWSLLLFGNGPLFAVESRPAASTAKPGAAFEPDGGWPHDLATAAGGTVTVYQPQIASWDGQRHMTAFAAVAYNAKAAAKPVLGTIKLEGETEVAVDERLVAFTHVTLSEQTFPGASNDQLRDIAAAISAAVPKGEMVIALDRVLARLDKSQILPRNLEGVKADPPAVFYSTKPAILVNVDGDPVWSPIQGSDLRFAVNTNWDLFEYSPDKTLYLRVEKSWLTAASIKGPWKASARLPDAFSKLPNDDNWREVKAALPGTAPSTAPQPAVFVSTTPAELLLLKGAPVYAPIKGTSLAWVSNTDSDLFRAGTTGPVYFLVSGRWFSAPGFNGPWTFATQTLPPDFKKIPRSHERSRVLASVPGTDEAAEAVLLAQIPQTARVDKKAVKAPDVEYDGSPKFEAIEKTSLARAVNTDKDIIKVGDLYYMCFQGVWFMGRSPSGPWEVTGSVPGQIYEIPVSSPAHNVTNVTVVEDHDDAVVFATAAAYTGLMIAWGCVVWGSGYYYPPYIAYGGLYPVYRPYYPTYGYHASYNPWTGTYSRGAAAYGPYGGAGVGARYNPRTGTYARGAAAYGPYGGRGYAQAYNPRTGAYGATRQGSNVYGSWGQTGVQRGDQWATTSRVTSNVTGRTTRTTTGSGGGGAITSRGPGGTAGIARTGSGDVYAGRDGNVYKRENGSWQQYNSSNGGWTSVQPRQPQARTTTADPATYGQLNRDAAARREGAQRTRTAAQAYSSGASWSSYSGRTRSAAGAGGRAGGFARRR